MTIRNAHAYLDGVWDWGCLDGCFGDTRIKPTDIDGLIERNGHKLIIETKGPGVAVPRAQLQVLKSFAEDDGHTVVVVWGNPGAPERMTLLKPFGYEQTKDTDLAGLRRLTHHWYEWANSERSLCTDAAQVARAIVRRQGHAYSIALQSELEKLNELKHR